MKYQEAILGGTFDHLHSGHKALLAAAFTDAAHVTIGLSKPELYQHKLLAEQIEPFEDREKQLKAYLEKHQFLDRATIIPLTDMYGTTLTDASIQAIYVTDITYPNAVVINQKREEQGFSPMQVHTIPFVKSSDGEVVTSQRIRYGEIDSKGNMYATFFSQKKQLYLPKFLREELSRPLGTVARNIEALQSMLPENTLLITVGDAVSESVQKANIPLAIAVIDNKNRRHPLSLKPSTNEQIANNAGSITKEAVRVYQTRLKKYFETKETQTLLISGEEDLLALPAILLAPLNSYVLYGQYGEGIVINHVTPELKKKIVNIIKQFR